MTAAIQTLKRLRSGIAVLDGLITDSPFIEFYGEWSPVSLLMHRFVVENGGDVILTQEFGGLNTYLIEKICRNVGKRAEARVVRSFSLDSTLDALRLAAESESQLAIVVDPYLYSPGKWWEYAFLTKVTAELRRLAQLKSVVVFNRLSKFGKKTPEGGAFHSSSIFALVRITSLKSVIHAALIKHPAQPVSRVDFTYAELYGAERRWGEQRCLSEWL